MVKGYSSEENKQQILQNYYKLQTSADLDPLLERIGDSRFVLLGEATHGTHEYYTWRTAISKRLIEEKGFSFIAVEGDWPDCYRINRFVKGYQNAGTIALDVLREFSRWPTWMWANWEIVALTEWLRKHNEHLPQEEKVGFYGLDVYSLWESMENILKYLEKEDPDTAELVKDVINCFEPYEEGRDYANAVSNHLVSCRDEVVDLLRSVRKNAPYYDHDREGGLNAEINALVTANAEKYYTAMVSFDEDSWNVRDGHMVATLEKLIDFHGPHSKVIVWEHNTHIGDARFTDMKRAGLFNVGQLVRQKFSREGVVIAGFGSYEGKVIAGKQWGAEMEEITLPPAREDSIEAVLHKDSPENKLLILNNPQLRQRFSGWMGNRAVGVVYRPSSEYGNYVPTLLTERYDAFLFIDKTKALFPLHIKNKGHITPDTFPFGV
jgi:erythromycin esterase